MRVPVRRVLAVNAGSRTLRLLMAEYESGHLRILKEQFIDLHQEGLVSAEETRTHLAQELGDWAHPPVALVLSQHLSMSQSVDAPSTPDSDVEQLIQEESVKLSGVSDSQIVYNFVRTSPPGQDLQQFWVTLARESDIRDNIGKLGLENEDLCHLTTTANSLIAAYRIAKPSSLRAVLLFANAETTVLAVVSGGAPAFATSFQMGGDFLTRSLARIRNCSEEKAYALRCSTDLLNGAEADAKFVAVVDGWSDELKRQLEEFRVSHGVNRVEGEPFEFVASGSFFDQPGILQYLQRKGFKLQPWPASTGSERNLPSKGFEVAFGAAVQALLPGEQALSLLPEDFRVRWRRRLAREKIEVASLALLLLTSLMLALGTWRQFSLVNKKQALLNKVQAAQTAADENDRLTAALISDYESMRPLFADQQNTIDTLSTLSSLEQARSNKTFWFVLIGDQQSYFTAPVNPGATNKPTRTNLVATATEHVWPFSSGPGRGSLSSTNSPPWKSGIIAELCVPEEPEVARITLSQVVKDLKQQARFSKVDLLSDDVRRNVADPKVVLPEKDFVLALDFADTDFAQAAAQKKPIPVRPANPTKRPSRTGADADGSGQSIP